MGGLWGTYHPELVEGPLPHPGKNIQGELHPLDQTSSSQLKPTRQIRICGNIVFSDFFYIETQSRADCAEPGYGTRVYMD